MNVKLNEAKKIAKLLRRESKWYKAYYGYSSGRDIAILREHLPKKGKILDVGGGVGRLAIPLAKHDYDVTLVDLIKEFLEIAKSKAKRKNVNIKILEGDVRKLKFKDEGFDAVIAMRDVINCCCDEYKKAFSEIVRVCKKKGIIVISSGTKYKVLRGRGIVDKFGIKGLYDVIIKDKTLPTGEGYDHKHFTLSELKSLFKEFRIKIIKIMGDSIVLPIIRRDAVKILSNKNNVKMIKEIDESLSEDEGNLNFFDHIIVIGRKTY